MFGRYFFQDEQTEPVTLRKTMDNLSCQWSNLKFQVKLEFWEHVYAFSSLIASQQLKTFLMRSVAMTSVFLTVKQTVSTLGNPT